MICVATAVTISTVRGSDAFYRVERVAARLTFCDRAGPFTFGSLTASCFRSVGVIAVGNTKTSQLVPDAARIENFTIVHRSSRATIFDTSSTLICVGIKHPRTTQSSSDARVVVVIEWAARNASCTKFLSHVNDLLRRSHQTFFRKVNNSCVTERITSFCPVAVGSEIHSQTKFFVVSKNAALLFTTARSPSTCRISQASCVTAVTITALTHAEISNGMPKATIDQVTDTLIGELCALVGALSTIEPRLTESSISIAASGRSVFEIAIGDTRSAVPDASVASATESFVRDTTAFVDATCSVVVLAVGICNTSCFIIRVVTETAVD